MMILLVTMMALTLLTPAFGMREDDQGFQDPGDSPCSEVPPDWRMAVSPIPIYISTPTQHPEEFSEAKAVLPVVTRFLAKSDFQKID